MSVTATVSIVRHDTATEFHCDRCVKDKKAKVIGSWNRPDGTIATICNGCYGNLLARGEAVNS